MTRYGRDHLTRSDAPGTTGGLAWLTQRAWLRASGADAGRFLHAQVSADLDTLGPDRVQPAAYCGPQGRVLAVPRFLRDGNQWLVELPSGLLSSVLQRLRLFVLREDVRLEPEERLGALGCWGEGALDRMAGAAGTPPRKAFECVTMDDVHCLRMPGAEPRFQLLGPRRALDAWWQRLAGSLPAGAAADWRLADIEAGLADVGPETADRHLPQSLGLERWDIVNYRKGCYPGQEVIARLHYRGRLKRRLHRATVDGPAPAPGTPVVDERGEHVGEVILAAPTGPDLSRLLAVLHERAAGLECRVGDRDAPPLRELTDVIPQNATQ